ncbi:uncharacterized protein LOC133030571 [Cannabis sativa]|uniref:uncharacterized protein LOC133030571 n=1 Tax=Cannabis sativa TaxID=3483 RepID=UPI0029CA3F87|nr:uncharacterized protein LOC133030571 [Cannabis sativa]
MSSSTSDPASATMATASSSAAPANPLWNPFSNSLTSSLTLKLDRLNFLSWKSQVVPTVIGHDLDDILFTGAPPPKNLVNGNPNLECLQWRKNDQLLLSWLGSSMFESILASVANYNSSTAVWRALEQKFVFPVDDQDLVLQLLNGLGRKFDSVVSGITSRSDALTVEEVQALLLTHECRLEHHQNMTDLAVKMQVDLAFGNGRSGGARPFASSKNPTNEVFQPTSGRGFDKNWVVPKSHQPPPRAHLTDFDFEYDPQAYSTTLVQDFGDDTS